MATPKPEPGYTYHTGSLVPSTFTKTGAAVALGTDGTNYTALQLDASGNLKTVTGTEVSMSINVGDVEIGAVELKNRDTDIRAIIGSGSAAGVNDDAVYVVDANVSASLASWSIGTGSADSSTRRVAVARNSSLSITDPDEDRMAIVVSASVADVDDYALVVADPVVSASMAAWTRGTGSADAWTQRVAVARNSAFSISDPFEDRMAIVVSASVADVDDYALVVADPVVSASLSISNTNPDLYGSDAYVSGAVVNNGDCKLQAVWGYNSGSASQFIQVFNTGSFPSDGEIPLTMFKTAAESNFYFDLSGKFGIDCTLGIVVCNSSTGEVKASGDEDCWFNVSYKV